MRVGDKITVPITGTEREKVQRTGRVLWIHPQRRFVLVEVDCSIPGVSFGERLERKIRECYRLAPPREQMCSALGESRQLPGRG